MKKFGIISIAFFFFCFQKYFAPLPFVIEKEDKISKKKGHCSMIEAKKEHSDRKESKTAVFLEIVAHKMPTKKDLEKISEEEAHDTPDALWEAAMLLGDVAEYRAQTSDPQEEKMILSFYEQCSKNKDYLDSVRELCHSHRSYTNRNLLGG